MNVTEFKAKCLQILKNLDAEGVVITNRGKEIAKVIPAGKSAVMKLYGSMKGKIVVKGAILSTRAKWNAQS